VVAIEGIVKAVHLKKVKVYKKLRKLEEGGKPGQTNKKEENTNNMGRRGPWHLETEDD